MNTPFAALQADEDALRILGKIIMRRMMYALLVGLMIGLLLGWVIFS